MEQLSGLCAKVIARRLPYTKAIYLLGKAPGNLRPVFLLIIVDASENRAGSDLIDLVEKMLPVLRHRRYACHL